MTEVRSLDLTGAVAPALSTTSDMPKPGVRLPPPKGAVSEEELRSGGTEQLKADKAKADANDDKKSDDTPASQKREISKADNRQREAEQRAQALEERLDRVLSTVEKLATRTDTEVKTQPADPRPKRHDFDDPDTYEDALVTWTAKTAAKVTQAQIEKQQKDREAEESNAKTGRELKKRADAWEKSRTAALEQYPDYEEVAESPDLSITQTMAFAIVEENLESGKGYEIAYHLGTHPEEAAKIAALPPQQQPLAIGRLAERLAAKPARVSKAPDPPRPLGSRVRAGEKSANEETMDEYAKRRNAELRANRHA